jgi:hypothetical protein
MKRETPSFGRPVRITVRPAPPRRVAPVLSPLVRWWREPGGGREPLIAAPQWAFVTYGVLRDAPE